MKSQDQIKSDLSQFHGSITYTKFSPLFPNVVLTEGAKYLADECGAYWLMDMIASHLPSLPPKEYWAVALLTVDNGKGLFTLANDSRATKFYAMQGINYTDFPLDEIKLYVSYDGEFWCVMLPSEY